MKSLLSALLLLLFHGNLIAQQEQSIDTLLTKAKAENKKVLLYFSGSDWCGPCIRFKQKYIEQPEFLAFAQSNLIIYNADFPRKKANQLSKETTQFNEELADVYNASGDFPKIILLDHSGNTIKMWESLPTESLEDFINYLR